MNNQKKLRQEADRLWGLACQKKWKDRCSICNGLLNCVHHYFPKGLYGHLRYDLDNGVPICASCHFKIHSRHDTDIIMKVRDIRGERWYEELRTRAHNNPLSYRGVKWYKENIERLNNYLMLTNDN